MSKHTEGQWAFHAIHPSYLDTKGTLNVEFDKPPVKFAVKSTFLKGHGTGEQLRTTVYVAEANITGGRVDEAEANARLICAALPMLSALKAIDASWLETFPGGPDGDRSYAGGLARLSDDTIEIWRQIQSAISKAEGNSNG